MPDVPLVQVGWARWDGDEFHGFRYSRLSDEWQRSLWPIGFIPVFARSVDAEGSVPAHDDHDPSDHLPALCPTCIADALPTVDEPEDGPAHNADSGPS